MTRRRSPVLLTPWPIWLAWCTIEALVLFTLMFVYTVILATVWIVQALLLAWRLARRQLHRR